MLHDTGWVYMTQCIYHPNQQINPLDLMSHPRHSSESRIELKPNGQNLFCRLRLHPHVSSTFLKKGHPNQKTRAYWEISFLNLQNQQGWSSKPYVLCRKKHPFCNGSLDSMVVHKEEVSIFVNQTFWVSMVTLAMSNHRTAAGCRKSIRHGWQMKSAAVRCRTCTSATTFTLLGGGIFSEILLARKTSVFYTVLYSYIYGNGDYLSCGYVHDLPEEYSK